MAQQVMDPSCHCWLGLLLCHRFNGWPQEFPHAMGVAKKKKIHARRFLWFRKDPGMTWMKGIIQWDILGFYVDLVTDVSGLFSPRSRQGVLEAW